MTIKIPLTQGKVALIDDEDYDKIKDIKFYAHFEKGVKWYALHSINDEKILMHRIIINAKPGQICDHINGDGLDNRRCNLRIVTNQQNIMNQRLQKRRKSSKYKGVTWNKNAEKWQTQIRINKNNRYLGLFINEIDAANTYDKKALELFGEYARLNFPEVLEVSNKAEADSP